MKKDKQELKYCAKEEYQRLHPYRTSLEGVWRDCSALTLPYIFPDEFKDESTFLPTPYNSIGPSAVNALAAKLLLALLPPTGNFFRLLPNEEAVQVQTKGMQKEQIKQFMDMLDTELSKLEQDVMHLINFQALRVPLFEAIKLLIVTGNSLVYKVKNVGIKVFTPYQYVIERDYAGNLTTLVILEKIAKVTLPDSVLELIDNKEAEIGQEGDCKDVEVYTLVKRTGNDKYQVVQEINKVKIPGTEKEYTKETLPYLPLRWTSVSNEDYGRGLVEQYLGDLRSLEGLTKMIVQGGGIMAKTIFGLKPSSYTKVDDLNNAQNGDFIMGDLEKDVTVLQVTKGNDMNVPYQLMQSLEQRLAKSFLMFSSQVRDSERTTAAEVRLVANELEATLGGTFSVLAADLQLPLLTLLLNEMEPKSLKVTTPTISTGIEAISRERDFQNLNTMLQSMAQLGEETINTYLNIPKYLSKIATSLGMDAQDIVKSQKQIQQEQQLQMQQEQQLQQQQQQAELQKAKIQKGQQ